MYEEGWRWICHSYILHFLCSTSSSHLFSPVTMMIVMVWVKYLPPYCCCCWQQSYSSVTRWIHLPQRLCNVANAGMKLNLNWINISDCDLFLHGTEFPFQLHPQSNNVRATRKTTSLDNSNARTIWSGCIGCGPIREIPVGQPICYESLQSHYSSVYCQFIYLPSHPSQPPVLLPLPHVLQVFLCPVSRQHETHCRVWKDTRIQFQV